MRGAEQSLVAGPLVVRAFNSRTIRSEGIITRLQYTLPDPLNDHAPDQGLWL
jgi:hypothetical protein